MLESLPPGRIIDRYLIEGRLGRGGMATVYKAQHRHLGTWHAIKILDVAAASVHRRLLLEGRVQASLQHPNVVAVTDVVEVDGALALVLEYIHGPTLAELLRQQPLTYGQADLLARGIFRGVHAAHRKGFVHRDLKPANILLQPTEHGFEPKVADFGLAKLLDDARGDQHSTRTGATMGTPQYMSPEQIRDAKDVDLRSDIFSLGAILYEMATGARAFEGADVVEVYNAVTQGWHVPPRDRKPDMPERMAKAIDAALQIQVDDRPQDCEALAAIWEGHLGLSPSHAPAVTPLPAAGAWTPEAIAAAMPDHPEAVDTPAPGTAGAALGAAGSEASATFFPSELTHGSIADDRPTSPTVMPADDSLHEAAPVPPSNRRGLILLVLGVLAVGASGTLLGMVLQAESDATNLPLAPEPLPARAPEPEPVVVPVVAPVPTEAVVAEPAPRPKAEPPPAADTPRPSRTGAEPKPTPPAPRPTRVEPIVPPVVAPVEAEAAAEVAPTPPAAATDALVTLTGKAPGVWLRSDAGSFKITDARRLAPGTYTINLVVDAGEPVAVGAITLKAGDRRTLRCDAAAVRCVW